MSTESDSLRSIIMDRVIKSNKIILEGVYLFNVYLLYILENNIKMNITTTTIRRCMRTLISGAGKSRSTGDANEDKLINHVKKIYFNNFDEDANNFAADQSFTFIKNSSENGLMKPLEAVCDSYYTLPKSMNSNYVIRYCRYQKIT